MSTTRVRGSLDNRARVARRRAQRLGLQLTQRGTVFTLCDGEITLALGPLAVVDACLIGRRSPASPGPPRSTSVPKAWAPMVDKYLSTLSAAGQRPLTLRLRHFQLCQVARGLGSSPEQVTGEMLVDWFGRQQHWSPEGRKSYRAGARGFFAWAHGSGRLPTNPGDDLPKVRVPKAPPRPASDEAWDVAWGRADARLRLILRLAGEVGLRRAEVACVHSDDVNAGIGGVELIVHGKGGKQRVVPVSESLAALLRQGAPGHTPGMPEQGWLFPNGLGGRMTAEHIGRLVTRALQDTGYSMHKLRARFATKAYRGSRNLRAVQELLGHASIATTERYIAVDADEIRAAAACAW
jgi:integrase/recombinase XerC